MDQCNIRWTLGKKNANQQIKKSRNSMDDLLLQLQRIQNIY